LDLRIKAELDWQCDMAEAQEEARLEGRSEGLAEGRSEANLENARKMKAMGFLAEQIQAVTGLSTETIERM
jgi:predicted transposase/invertase (TIGR01784 family)